MWSFADKVKRTRILKEKILFVIKKVLEIVLEIVSDYGTR